MTAKVKVMENVKGALKSKSWNVKGSKGGEPFLDFLGTNFKLHLGCFVKGSNSDPSVREQISVECSATGFSW